jgi:hypothetical protein
MTRLLVAIAVAAAATHARGQQLDTLYVGKAPVSKAYMHGDSSVWLVIARDSTAPNGQRVVGRMTERQRVVNGALFRVSHFGSAQAEVTDSVMTAGSGIVPISEISHQTSKLMRLTFHGRRTVGDVTPTGKATETIDQTTAVAPFNSSDVELVIQSLSLTPTYSALLATYEYESGGLRLDTLSVTGRDHNAWVVRISRCDASAMTFWYDPVTRHVTKQEFGSASTGWTMRILRQ